MATGWQRQFAAAGRTPWWDEKCLREDLQDGVPELEGKSVFWLACRYNLSERKIKRILSEHAKEKEYGQAICNTTHE